MVTISSNPMTLQEFLALPETKPPREYINGKIIQKPMPNVLPVPNFANTFQLTLGELFSWLLD